MAVDAKVGEHNISSVRRIGQQPRPQTHDGCVGCIEAAPLHLSVDPAGNAGYPGFRLDALPQSSGRVLKAQVRARCRALAQLPDGRIRLLYRGIELTDDAPIGKHIPWDCREPIEIHFMVLQGQEAAAVETADLQLSPGVPCPALLGELLNQCSNALSAGVEPMLTTGGTGGTYVLRREDRVPLAVFKPKDEEVGGPQNPRGYAGSENTQGHCRLGVLSSHQAVREVAAYLIDRGFAGVPMTTLAHGRHCSFMPLRGEGAVVWKVGSLQAFVETTEPSDNFGCQVYAAADVHRIGVLDVRIANLDRNYGNILVNVGRAPDGFRGLKLVPIDHGCSLPDRLQICCGDLVWMSWPQAKQPFSNEELEHIASLDGAADASLLRESLGLEDSCLRLLEVLTLWLQIAGGSGLTLYDVGVALCRDNEHRDVPSAIENAIASSLSTACAAAKCQSLCLPDSEGSSPLRRASTHSNEPCQTSDMDAIASAGIFDQLGLHVQWAPLLEGLFRQHVRTALEHLARSRASARQSAATQVCPAPLALRELPEEADSPESQEQGCSEGEASLPTRSAKAYLPPHIRRQVEAQKK